MEYIMEITIYCISVLILVTAFIVTSRKSKNIKQDEMTLTHFILRMPIKYGIFGILGYTFFSFLLLASSTFAHNETVTSFVYIIFGAFAFLSLFLVYGAIHEEVTVENNNITVVPLLGRTRLFNIQDIVQIKLISNQNFKKYKFYIKGKKVFSVYGACYGLEFMFQRLKHVKIKKSRLFF